MTRATTVCLPVEHIVRAVFAVSGNASRRRGAIAGWALLLALVGCGGGGGGGGGGGTTADPVPTPSLSVAKSASSTSGGGAAVQLTATVANTNSPVLWTLSGPGSLSATSGASVTYTPPGPESLTEAAVAQVTATLGTLTQTLSVNLTTAPGHQWVSAQPALGALNAVIHVNGQYYAAADGEVLRSTDGVDWQTSYVGQPKRIRGLANSAQGWVAVGDDGMTAWSADATTWTRGSYSGKPAQNFFGVVAAGGMYVAWGVGDSGIYYSTDGKVWAAADTGGVTMVGGVVHANGHFLARVFAGNSLSSTDGVHWQAAVAPAACPWLSSFTAFNNGYFAIQGPQTCTSADAQTWVAGASATNSGIYGATLFGSYAGTLYAGWQNALLSSKDGLTWTTKWGGNVPDGYVTGFASNGSSAVVTAYGRYAISKDLQTWSTPATALTTTVRKMDQMNGVIVALGADGSLSYSEDAKHWAAATGLSIPAYLTAITHGKGMFVAIDNSSGGMYTSQDGKAWIAAPFNGPTPTAITFDGTNFVAVGPGGAMKSADAKTWQFSPFAAVDADWTATSITYAKGRYIASAMGAVLSSVDGLSWTRQPTTVGGWWQGVAASPDGFVIVGAKGAIMSSADGSAWTQQASGTVNQLNGVTYVNGEYVVVGDNGDILFSVDAVNWIRRAPITGAGLTAVCADAGVVIAGGEGGTVLKSTQ